MFAGTKKRERNCEAEDDEENRIQSPFGSAAQRGNRAKIMSPRAEEMVQIQSPKKLRTAM